MRHKWDENTQFKRVVLEPDNRKCPGCGRNVHICDHRTRRILGLRGPIEITSKLSHCPDPMCSSRPKTFSPAAELSLSMPSWLIGWDVFAWMGFRRFSWHWSVADIRRELAESWSVRISDDSVEHYLGLYQSMVAARQQDPEVLAAEYRGIKDLVLTIDGLQPEKGHETLYVVRELRSRRVWFAEPLLSSAAGEVRKLLERAKAMAAALNLPVTLWMSDKQDAFVSGIAEVFPGVPHRFCGNHFLRDLAQPVLKADSKAKVKMRRKVRGLRAIERSVLEGRTAQAENQTAATSENKVPDLPPASAGDQVVLDYCAATRGVLNDDHGGPLHPPGIRMAGALRDIHDSLQRNFDEKKTE